MQLLLHGEADPRQVVDEASRRDVDLLALVEVTPAALQAMDTAGFASCSPIGPGRHSRTRARRSCSPGGP